MWNLVRKRLQTAVVTRSAVELFDQSASFGADRQSPLDDLLMRFNRLAVTSFGGAVHVRHVDAGSCNACEWELNAILNPVYDISRMRIDFVASPRHADLLTVTGGVTRNLLEALRKTYEATAFPKAIVAIGGCAIGEGLLRKNYAQEGGIAPFVPIHVKVPGCPPRPKDIMEGLLLAMERLNNEVEHNGS